MDNLDYLDGNGFLGCYCGGGFIIESDIREVIQVADTVIPPALDTQIKPAGSTIFGWDRYSAFNVPE